MSGIWHVLKNTGFFGAKFVDMETWCELEIACAHLGLVMRNQPSLLLNWPVVEETEKAPSIS